MIAQTPNDAAVERTPAANVLVVDDVPQNLVAMRALLQDDGIHVMTARSGPEALELLLAHDFAVALLDVQMPDMDGFELAELMRGTQRTREVPIIFITATPQEPGRAFRGYDAGAVDFLHKPVDGRILAGKVKVFVELHRQRSLLRARNETLQQALALNEKMMAVLSHDLRNPLSVIHVSAFNLGLMSQEPRILDTARRIQSSAQRMTRMIEQLLDFSRLRAGGLGITPAPGRLDRIAEQAADECRQANPAVPITVEASGDVQAVFDHDRLAQVFSNLLANATRHAGGDIVQVRLDGSSRERVHIDISNAGQLPEALIPRLFEPFKATFHEGGGLGLGLHIVEQFVRAHGGEVEGRNEDGRVVFTVRLPRTPRIASPA